MYIKVLCSLQCLIYQFVLLDHINVSVYDIVLVTYLCHDFAYCSILLMYMYPYSQTMTCLYFVMMLRKNIVMSELKVYSIFEGI